MTAMMPPAASEEFLSLCFMASASCASMVWFSSVLALGTRLSRPGIAPAGEASPTIPRPAAMQSKPRPWALASRSELGAIARRGTR